MKRKDTEKEGISSSSTPHARDRHLQWGAKKNQCK